MLKGLIFLIKKFWMYGLIAWFITALILYFVGLPTINILAYSIFAGVGVWIIASLLWGNKKLAEEKKKK